MSKSKKKPDTPPVKARKYVMPTEYLDMVADRILTTNPTKEIIFNTLCGVYQTGRTNGYFEKNSESARFRDKREATIKEMFDSIQDMVSDKIHGGVIDQSTNQKDK